MHDSRESLTFLLDLASRLGKSCQTFVHTCGVRTCQYAVTLFLWHSKSQPHESARPSSYIILNTLISFAQNIILLLCKTTFSNGFETNFLFSFWILKCSREMISLREHLLLYVQREWNVGHIPGSSLTHNFLKLTWLNGSWHWKREKGWRLRRESGCQKPEERCNSGRKGSTLPRDFLQRLSALSATTCAHLVQRSWSWWMIWSTNPPQFHVARSVKGFRGHHLRIIRSRLGLRESFHYDDEEVGQCFLYVCCML